MNKVYIVAVMDKVLVSHAGLRAIISNLHDFKVFSSHNSIEGEQINFIGADVLLYSTRTISGYTFTELNELKAISPNLPLVILAPGIGYEEQFKLIKLGIRGLIIEEATLISLHESLLCAVNKGIYYPCSLLEKLLENTPRLYGKSLVKAAFSDLQQQILQLLASGLTTPAVAEKLYRSTRTIEWHKEMMMKTVKVKSTSQLLLFALEYGIIESPFYMGRQYDQSSEVKEDAQQYFT